MKHLALLATALLLLPLHALASTTQSLEQPALGTVRVDKPCSPVNPCAVPTPLFAAPAADAIAKPARAKAGRSAQLRTARPDIR